jgi:cob(I)alamin adenosyltransferase
MPSGHREGTLTSKTRKGLVQVFTGSGKGKTTAAVGTIVRAAGHGLKVCLVSFMKGKYAYGEYRSLSRLPGVEVAQYGVRKFTDPARLKSKEKEQARAALAAARRTVTGGAYDVVVLDEINVAVCYDLISLDEVIQLIRDKPSHVELILTGRYADNRLLEAADLVTEMVKVKHPFDAGITARKGIEY